MNVVEKIGKYEQQFELLVHLETEAKSCKNTIKSKLATES